MNNSWFATLTGKKAFLIGLGIIVITASILLLMGRVPWCTCGDIKLWHGVVFSSENSQHISDWYTFTHIIHGFVFFAILRFIGKRRGWSIGFTLLLAIFLESAWEILENSDFIINRYREVTISLDYFGDSVLNSISDIFAMMFGFFLALKLRPWLSVVTVVAIELALLYFIRDNLTINLIMLIHPLDSIKVWQQML